MTPARYSERKTGSVLRTTLCRPWIARLAVLIFLAGLGHVWLHDARIGDAGHFGAAIEKACPLEKLTSTVHVIVPKPHLSRRPHDVARLHAWSRVVALDISTAPRGPPIA